MEGITLEHIKNELVSGIKKRKHPYRFFTLATLDDQNQPQTRTVVLRDVNEALQLYFFTDARSQKVQQLARNPVVSALFYHPKKQLQLQINGKAAPIEDQVLLQRFWSYVGERSKRDYSTSKAPGSPLTEGEAISYLRDSHHFSVIKITPHSVGYLKLQQPDHLKGIYSSANGQWQHQYLVP